MTKNIFVIGADEFNCRQLQAIHADEVYAFHNLLTFEQVKGGGHYPSFDGLIQQAESVLADFQGSIDAIIGYWDFPVNSMVPILCQKHRLPSPSLESELKCDHKYWSRREQQAIIPEHTPAFAAFDPFDADATAQLELDFPFWIKPVKSTDSVLAFKVDDASGLETALNEIRQKIGRIASAFNELLAHAHLPAEIAAVDGAHCIVEQLIVGHQCTVEGHVYQGEVIVHGVIDSYNYPNSSSFFRYEYPSHLPQRVKDAMVETSRRIMSHIGFNNGGFNIEYFYNKETDDYKLLEINPRISQSHSQMLKYVDGTSNHQIMVELALGNRPQFKPGAGEYNCAAKFHLRRFEDDRVIRVPTEEEIEAILAANPGTDIDIIVKEGMRLSELIEQDSYSYDMAHVHIGAQDQTALLKKYQRIVDALPFEFEGGTANEWKRA